MYNVYALEWQSMILVFFLEILPFVNILRNPGLASAEDATNILTGS